MREQSQRLPSFGGTLAAKAGSLGQGAAADRLEFA
jgi:hypothetical protein